MKNWQRVSWLGLGLLVGGLVAMYYTSRPRLALAGNDRADDCLMCTGTITLDPKSPPIDCIWLLDYRSGKLRATVVDRTFGKILPWADLDLVQEFNIAPKQNVHFMMTTGAPANGPSPLYVAETATGRFGIYSLRMGPLGDGRQGLVISRHEGNSFR